MKEVENCHKVVGFARSLTYQKYLHHYTVYSSTNE